LRTFKAALLLAVLSGAGCAQPHNGTLVGSPTFATGKFSQALASTSDSNYVSLPSGVFPFTASSSWTIEAWLKTTATAVGVAICGGESAGGSYINNIWLGINSSGHFVSSLGNFTGTSGQILDSGTAINDGNWHHVAVVMTSGTSETMFVDGTKSATVTSGSFVALPATGGDVGTYIVLSGYPWAGAIDEVAVWSTNKYTANFTPPSSPYVGTETNLTELYHLDGTANDSKAGPTFSVSPSSVTQGTNGNAIALTGTGTSWTPGTPGSPVFTLAGGTGAAITAQTVASATSATVTVAAGSATGTLTITDPSSAATGTVAVTPSAMTILMNNPAILYSPFNWNVSSSSANTINSGGYFKVIFSGTSLALTTNTSADASPYSELWARIDNQGWTQYTLSAGNPTLSLATGLQARNHLVEVVVKSTSETINRWSSSQTMVTIASLVLDPSATVEAPLRRSKNILIFGDSITEGVRTKNATATNDTDRNDVLGEWSWELGTAIDAEVGIVGFGSSGITVGGSGGVPALPGSYNYIYSGVSRSFSSPAPDLVIYNEGTNDSGSVVAAFETVVNAILAAAPNAKQLLLVPFNGTHATDIASVIAAVGNSNVTMQGTTGWFNSVDSSDGVHPYDYSGVGLIAPNLFPVVRALLGSASAVPVVSFQ
jgi:lysophospholipase L1-like esterase